MLTFRNVHEDKLMYLLPFKPLEDQESLCQDKLPGSTDDVQPEGPDKNDKAVENQQPFGDKAADDMLTQPYCADVKISEQPSPGNTDRQEVRGVRTYPRRKHLKRSESGKSKQIIPMQEVPPVEGPDHGGVECKESAVTEVKSVKTARGRSKAKVASVNLGQDQTSKKARKRGSLSTKSKLNGMQNLVLLSVTGMFGTVVLALQKSVLWIVLITWRTYVCL